MIGTPYPISPSRHPKTGTLSALDSMVSEEWYRKQTQDLELLQQGILTELGDLKPDLENDEDKDQQDQEHSPVDQEGIKVFLSQLIKDKLAEDFLICEVNEEQVPIDYIPIQHDEYFSQMSVSCYPVQRRASTQKTGAGKGGKDDASQLSDQDNQEPKYSTSNGYNNQAKSSLDIIPKIMSAVSPNYKNYTKFLPGADLESIKRVF